MVTRNHCMKRLRGIYLTVSSLAVSSFLMATGFAVGILPAPAQNNGQNNAATTALTIRSDVQEANAKTGVVTAKGNVQMNYPARQIVATSAQAQYFSKERRIVLTGNVIVTQVGNRIKAETITYLIDEGKFEAIPPGDRQVESIYIVPDDGAGTSPAAATTPVKVVKPVFKSSISPAVPAPGVSPTPSASPQPELAPAAKPTKP